MSSHFVSKCLISSFYRNIFSFFSFYWEKKRLMSNNSFILPQPSLDVCINEPECDHVDSPMFLLSPPTVSTIPRGVWVQVKSQASCVLAMLLPRGCEERMLSRSRPTSKSLIQRSRGLWTADSSDWQRGCEIISWGDVRLAFCLLLLLFSHQTTHKY